MRRSALCLLSAALLTSCSSSAGEGVTVATTIYPVAWIAEQVADERAEVVNVTPPGAEPHDVELSPDQVGELQSADVVAYIGRNFQPAVEDALADVQGESLDVLGSVGPPLEDADGEVDVHFWLDPTRLALLATEMGELLTDADPEGADLYRRSAEDLSARLRQLDRDFMRRIAGCSSTQLVTAHEAFAYLADRYGLQQIGIAGLDPEGEPSPQRVADVAELVRENGIGTIFFETLLSPAAAETIARETGAETAVLDPLESGPEKGDYITAMTANIDTIARALGCR